MNAGDRVRVVRWFQPWLVGLEGRVLATTFPVALAGEVGYAEAPIITVEIDDGTLTVQTGDAGCFEILP